MKQKKNYNIRQMVRFGIVGAMNTLVDYGVFYILISVANLHKAVAQIGATAVAMSGSFFINRYWTFGRSGRGNKREIVKFLVVNLLAMGTLIFFTHIFHDILHIERFAEAVLQGFYPHLLLKEDHGILICKAIASLFSVTINFLGNKFWVFAAGEDEKYIM